MEIWVSSAHTVVASTSMRLRTARRARGGVSVKEGSKWAAGLYAALCALGAAPQENVCRLVT